MGLKQKYAERRNYKKYKNSSRRRYIKNARLRKKFKSGINVHFLNKNVCFETFNTKIKFKCIKPKPTSLNNIL